MRIGLIKETKTPEDNRVALSPVQVAKLNREYPNSKIVVQSSGIRAFTDEEYWHMGVKEVRDVSECDVLFGIKEAQIDTLIPYKCIERCVRNLFVGSMKRTINKRN